MSSDIKFLSDNKYEIDMDHCDQSSGLIARKIWQELFKVYKEECDLNHMDSFLCDINIFTKIVDEAKKNYSPTRFMWEADGWYTDVNVCDKFSNPNYVSYHKVFMIIEYMPSERKFTVERMN